MDANVTDTASTTAGTTPPPPPPNIRIALRPAATNTTLITTTNATKTIAHRGQAARTTIVMSPISLSSFE